MTQLDNTMLRDMYIDACNLAIKELKSQIKNCGNRPEDSGLGLIASTTVNGGGVGFTVHVEIVRVE